MSEDVQIRLVNIEFLRPGPPHNQLLSPLAQYVTVCGDAGGGVVTVPYEHGQLERLLKQLCYQGPEDRRSMLHDLGMAMGRFLGDVPGLPSALTVDLNQPRQLVHLRLTFSASELALLPFEVAKAPVLASVSGESWLSVQTRPPVCLTRNIRTISPEDVVWPDRPRILFISGNPEDVPYEEHRRVLLKAIERFHYPDRADQKSEPRRDQFGDVLTILVDPTLGEVFQECKHNLYTHIHVLTYGDLDERSPGLVFRGPNGAPDVVSGDRFKMAITSIHHRPTVVTVASCVSRNVASVFVSGASFAHELHQAGIPLVVAAHFPLSIEGSVLLTARLYTGLLLGEHPLWLLQQARAELHATYAPNGHDWASLVVYEALPSRLIRTEREQTSRSRSGLEQRLDGAGVSHILSGIAKRGVLILGRFTNERKAVLDAIKGALTTPPREYVPILFDFEKPVERDLIESIVRFASVSRFVVADLSDPKSIPAELQAIVPQFPSLPVVPIIEASQLEYPVADNILRRESVVKPVVKYRDQAHLLDVLEEQVLEPAERLYAQLNPERKDSNRKD